MSEAVTVAEVTRGGRVESIHRGHIVICGPDGEVQSAWGDPTRVIYPRSSCKMVQALPLAESGLDLTPQQLALACASHQGALIHVQAVRAWLADLGLTDDDLRCGSEPSRDKDLRFQMIRDGESPCQVHNNCSGKHAGFLALAQHLGAGPEYVDLDHPVQKGARAALEETADEEAAGYGLDGCSAPNFAISLAALGRSMASFATAHGRSGTRAEAQARLVAAMAAHPDLVAGETRACTDLMRAGNGKIAVKTGAEGVFVAILPETGQSVALKVEDGTTRAANAAIAGLLVKLGAVPADDPQVARHLTQPLHNRRGMDVGDVRAVGL